MIDKAKQALSGLPDTIRRIPPKFLGIGAGAIAVVIVLALVVPAIGNMGGSQEPAPQVAGPATVTLAAVGDNLPDQYVGYYADSLKGSEGDGQYDYAPIYEPIKPYIEGVDLAYIDEETHIGGAELGPQGYPSFNTTDEMIDAIAQTGFDFVATATNHSFDWGLYGAAEHSVNAWEKSGLAFTGTANTEEQYNRIVTLERNGITFALLAYTYGLNGFTPEQTGPYAVNLIDEKRIASDVARAKEKADVVLVAMHWGTELLMEADEEQKRLGQFLADLDVDVVLGSHPHVIGPMAWVENSNGSGHRTLVAYSLGNFLSDHDSPTPEAALEGMLTCDFVRSEAGGAVTVENPKWVPVVCHATDDRSNFAIYAVGDYTEELAKENRSLKEFDDPIGWLNETTAKVVGSEWL